MGLHTARVACHMLDTAAGHSGCKMAQDLCVHTRSVGAHSAGWARRGQVRKVRSNGQAKSQKMKAAPDVYLCIPLYSMNIQDSHCFASRGGKNKTALDSGLWGSSEACCDRRTGWLQGLTN